MLRTTFSRFLETPTKSVLPNISRIILTGSCKGGVGKSTVALNTAISLSKSGAKVGLFDADIFGPSIPLMSSTTTSFLTANASAEFIPVDKYGISTVSVGYASDQDKALVWKGPLVGQVISELLRKAIWPKLDYLIVDTPPGTGDVHLSLSQLFEIDGIILVTTPQKVTTADVVRSVDAFRNLNVPILGLIQNFSSFVCEGCGTTTQLFPGNGGEVISTKYKLPLLGSLPIDPEVAKSGDSGVPIVLGKPDSICAKAFANIADTIFSLYPRKPL